MDSARTISHLALPDDWASALAAGAYDLSTLISSPLVVEQGEPDGENFPHVYGPIDLDAVVSATPWLRTSDGTFEPGHELGPRQ